MKTARHQNEDENTRFQTLAVLVSKTSLSYQRGGTTVYAEALHPMQRRPVRTPEPLRQLGSRSVYRLNRQLTDLIRSFRSSITSPRRCCRAARGLSRPLSALTGIAWALKSLTSNRVSDSGGMNRA